MNLNEKTNLDVYDILFQNMIDMNQCKSENVNIRECKPTDIKDLVATINLAYRSGKSLGGWTDESHLLGGTRIEDRGLVEILQNPNEKLLIAEVTEGEPRPVGCVRVQFEKDYVYIGMLTVDPRLQKNGIGKKLLMTAENLSFIKWGYQKSRMSVFEGRDALIQWYKKQGYSDTGERSIFNPDDPMYGVPKVEKLEFVILEKKLNQNESSEK